MRYGVNEWRISGWMGFCLVGMDGWRDEGMDGSLSGWGIKRAVG